MLMEIVAWFAAGLVFLAFFMRTIVPLRALAIASNVAFISYALLGLHYGIFAKVLPIFVLHGALLPLNIMRLREVTGAIRSVRSVTLGHASLDFLIPFMRREKLSKGQWLFKKGDAADRLFVLDKGRLKLEEVGKDLAPGSVFGEIGVFSENETRTASARCLEDAELFSITRDKAVELFYQDPRFGFFIVRALSHYVLEHDRQMHHVGLE